MNKRNPWISRVFWTTAAILWMALIFYLSSQTGVQSSGLSGRVCRWLCRNFIPGFSTLRKARQRALLKAVSFYVRKAAHFGEFAILGFLFSMTAGSYGLSSRKRVLLAIVLAVCWACCDEAHQLGVLGRSGEFRDVLIDSAGILLGVLASLRAGTAVCWGVFGVYLAAFLHYTLLGRTPVTNPVFEPHPFTALRRCIYLEKPVPEILRILLAEGPGEARKYVEILQTWSLRGLALNILLFIPMGFFLSLLVPLLRGKEKRYRKADKKAHAVRTRVRAGFAWKALLMCLLISVAVEIIQYRTRLGAFDADDLLCNAIGALIGCILAWIMRNCFIRLNRRLDS